MAALLRRPPAPPRLPLGPASSLDAAALTAVAQARMYNKARKSEVATRMKKVSSRGAGAGHGRHTWRSVAQLGCNCCSNASHFAAAGQQSCGCRCLAQSAALVGMNFPLPPAPTAAFMPNAHRLQVLTALDAFKSAPPAAEADLAPVQTLINEAYQGEGRAGQLWGLGRPDGLYLLHSAGGA